MARVLRDCQVIKEHSMRAFIAEGIYLRGRRNLPKADFEGRRRLEESERSEDDEKRGV